MITKTKIAVAAALFVAVTAPVFTASVASARDGASAYAYASSANAQYKPGSVEEKRWFERGQNNF